MTIQINGTTVIDSNRNIILGSGLLEPSNPSIGTLWFNTSADVLKGFNGNTWVNLMVVPSSAWSWGRNTEGQLGDGTTTDRSSPVSVVGGFTDWVQVAGSVSHSLGVRTNGTAWSWGNNDHGRLGDNTITRRSSPVSVVGGFTDWIRVAGVGYHSLGIRANGTMWSWGRNGNGQLGDGTTTDRSSPVSVVGGFTDWVQVAGGPLGWYHNLGIRANSTAWSWGRNTDGQLGDGTTTNRSSPVSVVGGFTDWVQVASGGYCGLGIRANGTMWSWGRNGNGQLGDGTTTNRSSPVSVVGGFTDWKQLSSGSYHSLGIRDNGTIWSWGGNTIGQLGDGTTINRNSPVSVVGGFTDWVQVAGGRYHNLGIRANGTIWSWGRNIDGQLGDNTLTNRSSPVSVIGGFTNWIQVAAAGQHSLGVRSS